MVGVEEITIELGIGRSRGKNLMIDYFLDYNSNSEQENFEI
jgi:peptidyl-tRNA hydrolase